MDTDQTARTIRGPGVSATSCRSSSSSLSAGRRSSAVAAAPAAHPAATSYLPSTRAGRRAVPSNGMDVALPAEANEAWAAPTGVHARDRVDRGGLRVRAVPTRRSSSGCRATAAAARWAIGSNLDCYIKPRPTGTIAFEEHASYCDICVQITLQDQAAHRPGGVGPRRSPAIDALFGGSRGRDPHRGPTAVSRRPARSDQGASPPAINSPTSSSASCSLALVCRRTRTPVDIQNAHDELTAFLEHAPRDLGRGRGGRSTSPTRRTPSCPIPRQASPARRPGHPRPRRCVHATSSPVRPSQVGRPDRVTPPPHRQPDLPIAAAKPGPSIPAPKVGASRSCAHRGPRRRRRS